MTAEQAIRYLAHEAKRCRDRDACESFCLLLPSILNGLHLEPMHYTEALEFTIALRQSLRDQAHVMTGADFQNQ